MLCRLEIIHRNRDRRRQVLKLKIAFAAALCLIALIAATLIGRKPAESSVVDAESYPTSSDNRIPILVELFTSEGCSSCPPADELLMRLDEAQPVPDAEVIALSEHVDYWNHLGWADPYSSATFSARQNDYARAFDTGEVYTPQMIVDGRVQFVGSNSNRARDAIAAAAREPKAAVTLNLGSQNPAAASIILNVRVENLPVAASDHSCDVTLAITESGLRSSVARGENAGRHLTHTAVVRKLSHIGGIDPHKASTFSAQPIVRIDKTWKRDGLRVVAFVQERSSRRIIGAARLSLARLPVEQ